jgi:hypothetical protein
MTNESEQHLLSFVTDTSGQYVAIHADLRGITILIEELQNLREQLELDDCPHTHLFSFPEDSHELTTTKLVDQQNEVNVVCHVKIYGWNEEWAQRHGLKPSPSGSNTQEPDRPRADS